MSNLWYLDDGTLGGDPLTVASTMELIQRTGEELGLRLNLHKCDVYVFGDTESNKHYARSLFTERAPGIQSIPDLTVLGAPL